MCYYMCYQSVTRHAHDFLTYCQAPYGRRFILFQFRTGSKVAKKAARIQKIDTAVKSLPFS